MRMLALALSLHSLSLATARTAVTTYERLYWKGEPVTVTVAGCRRRSTRQVTCISTVTQGSTTITTEDWATRLGNGEIRVHPGKFWEVSR